MSEGATPMDEQATEARLARTVAQAADAWLTDPLDGGVYERLVRATLAWRHYTHPVLEGTENAGRRDRAQLTPSVQDLSPGRPPTSVGQILRPGEGGDARTVLAALRGSLPAAAGPAGEADQAPNETSP